MSEKWVKKLWNYSRKIGMNKLDGWQISIAYHAFGGFFVVFFENGSRWSEEYLSKVHGYNPTKMRIVRRLLDREVKKHES